MMIFKASCGVLRASGRLHRQIADCLVSVNALMNAPELLVPDLDAKAFMAVCAIESYL